MTLATYQRYRNFYEAQQVSPGTVLNGLDFETEFNRIKAFADAVVVAIGDVDGGDVASVGIAQLKSEVLTLLNGVTVRGDWVTATAYAKGNLARNAGDLYLALVSHTSSNFASDLAAKKWALITSQGETGATGAAGPSPWGAPAAWVTATAYTAAAPASLVTSGSETYACLVDHTSGVFATDLAVNKWIKVAGKGATGAAGAAGANWSTGETIATPSILSGVLTINLANGTVFKVQNNANITSLVISGAPAGKASGFLLELFGTGTGFTFNGLKIAGGVLKAAGGAEFPTPTTTSGKKDVFSCWTDDGGTTWNYAVVGQAF